MCFGASCNRRLGDVLCGWLRQAFERCTLGLASSGVWALCFGLAATGVAAAAFEAFQLSRQRQRRHAPAYMLCRVAASHLINVAANPSAVQKVAGEAGERRHRPCRGLDRIVVRAAWRRCACCGDWPSLRSALRCARVRVRGSGVGALCWQAAAALTQQVQRRLAPVGLQREAAGDERGAGGVGALCWQAVAALTQRVQRRLAPVGL
eukprot:363435-Chlamydomonas_euryale.AAC.2